MIGVLLTLLLSAGLCACYLSLARRWQIVDRPNERSSHSQPTPHGGGVPLYLAFALGVWGCGLYYGPWDPVYILFIALALFLMLVGVADDFRGLPVKIRLFLYASCALGVVAYLCLPAEGGFLYWLCVIVTAIALLWLMNLYNFMDGIDGIAAIQCILACASAALLSWFGGGDSAYPLFCLLLGASHLGFLCWNLPPARLFMGDAGSVPTGFLLGTLALLGALQGQLNPLCWAILLAGFVTDASYTLLWRMVTGQPFTQPHRLHAYQRLSRRLESHLWVDMGLVALNALWLFPLAWAVQIWPNYGFLLVILAYLPLLAGMAKVRHLA